MAIIGACMVPHPPIILPEVGKGEEKKIQTTADAYHEAAREIAALAPDTIVLSSPHSIMYLDYFHISPGKSARGNMGRFQAGSVKFHTDYDADFVKRLADLAKRENLPAGTLGEKDPSLDHGTMVPLYFVNQAYTDYKLVRIGLSGLPYAQHYKLGMLVKEAAEQLSRNVYFIGSGDLSHKLQSYGPYGYAPDGPVYDQRIMDVMGRAAFGELFSFPEDFCERAAECGHRSFLIMAGALDRTGVEARWLIHEDVFGVGYGICTYRVTGTDPSRDFLSQWEKRQQERLAERQMAEDPYVRLARASLTSYLVHRKRMELPEGLPEEMLSQRAGAFVSIHKGGRLRGCIGTIAAVQNNLAEEILENAISASTQDPRFPAITADEIPELEISVDVLGEAEDIPDSSLLDVKRYGVIVTKGRKRGLLLPNLEGVDSVEQQIRIAKQKAGIGEDDPDVRLARFEVVRHY